MAWTAAANLPFVPIFNDIGFSPIIANEVYLIDRSTNNFWKYHIGSRIYTKLANRPYTGETLPATGVT